MSQISIGGTNYNRASTGNPNSARDTVTLINALAQYISETFNVNLQAQDGAIKINYNNRGIITGASNILAADIPDLPLSKITDLAPATDTQVTTRSNNSIYINPRQLALFLARAEGINVERLNANSIRIGEERAGVESPIIALDSNNNIRITGAALEVQRLIVDLLDIDAIDVKKISINTVPFHVGNILFFVQFSDRELLYEYDFDVDSDGAVSNQRSNLIQEYQSGGLRPAQGTEGNFRENGIIINGTPYVILNNTITSTPSQERVGIYKMLDITKGFVKADGTTGVLFSATGEITNNPNIVLVRRFNDAINLTNTNNNPVAFGVTPLTHAGTDSTAAIGDDLYFINRRPASTAVNNEYNIPEDARTGLWKFNTVTEELTLVDNRLYGDYISALGNTLVFGFTSTRVNFSVRVGSQPLRGYERTKLYQYDIENQSITTYNRPGTSTTPTNDFVSLTDVDENTMVAGTTATEDRAFIVRLNPGVIPRTSTETAFTPSGFYDNNGNRITPTTTRMMRGSKINPLFLPPKQPDRVFRNVVVKNNVDVGRDVTIDGDLVIDGNIIKRSSFGSIPAVMGSRSKTAASIQPPAFNNLVAESLGGNPTAPTFNNGNDVVYYTEYTSTYDRLFQPNKSVSQISPIPLSGKLYLGFASSLAEITGIIDVIHEDVWLIPAIANTGTTRYRLHSYKSTIVAADDSVTRIRFSAEEPSINNTITRTTPGPGTGALATQDFPNQLLSVRYDNGIRDNQQLNPGWFRGVGNPFLSANILRLKFVRSTLRI